VFSRIDVVIAERGDIRYIAAKTTKTDFERKHFCGLNHED